MATKNASKKKTTGQKTSSSSAKTKTKAKNPAQGVVEPVLRRAKSTGWVAILESIVIGVLGVLLVVSPDSILKVIFYVVGIFLIVKGVYHVINYFAIHGKYDFYNNDLLYGIVALVFGIVCVVLWEKLGNAIGIVVGAWMIYGALVRMNTAIKLHAAGMKDWFYVLLLALVMLALGVYMIISVGAVLTVVGWIMIAAAVVGIVDDALFIRNIDAIME